MWIEHRRRTTTAKELRWNEISIRRLCHAPGDGDSAQSNDRIKLIECDLSALGRERNEDDARLKKIQRKRMLRWLPGTEHTHTNKLHPHIVWYFCIFFLLFDWDWDRCFDWIVFSVWFNYHNFTQNETICRQTNEENIPKRKIPQIFSGFDAEYCSRYFLTVNHIPFGPGLNKTCRIFDSL